MTELVEQVNQMLTMSAPDRGQCMILKDMKTNTPLALYINARVDVAGLSFSMGSSNVFIVLRVVDVWDLL